MKGERIFAGINLAEGFAEKSVNMSLTLDILIYGSFQERTNRE